ncbi:MAG: hypothetical protein Q8L42_01485, partial [Sulfurimicrobium sp.]|nr:hypothetical protein [Sulfurimicrobium sp.]MDP3686449.1 hypothetical protein [Sulfurimicrobium sp.]
MGSFSIFHWAILMAVGWFLFSVFGARRNGTKTYETYVIKEWVACQSASNSFQATASKSFQLI